LEAHFHPFLTLRLESFKVSKLLATCPPFTMARRGVKLARLKSLDATSRRLKVSRHSCASVSLNDGVSLKMISERLGHSSIAVTADIYAVVEEAQQREVSERIERLFATGKK
jgi:integrase